MTNIVKYMIPVLRVLLKINRAKKGAYNTNYRNSIKEWPKEVAFSDNQIIQNTLFVPSQFKSLLLEKTNSIKSITLIENIDSKEISYITQPIQNKVCPISILEIIQINPSNFDVHLNYSKNKNFIGAPTRDNHKIGVLKTGSPLLYKINGKIDWEDLQRYYNEIELYIEHIGNINNIEINTKMEKIPFTIDEAKVIDERKILY